MTTPSVAVIGAGASGTLLSLHLLHHAPAGTQITLIERNPQSGPGLAYATTNPHHLLNVPVGRMSAFADQPDHFLDWLQRQPMQTPDGVRPDATTFVPRRLYGAYLRDLLSATQPALNLLHDEVVAIDASVRCSTLRLASGRTLSADIVVLATGNGIPAPLDVPALQRPSLWRPDPWAADAFAELAPGAPVLLIGTGLTMVDAVITLLDQGHAGVIHAISRRGLLPRCHASAPPAPPLQLPLPRGLRELTRLVRQQSTTSAGAWRSIVDDLRPLTQEIWQSLSITDRQRFLRHLRPWWDVHRHRMPQEIAERIDAARANGQLRILAGRVTECEPGEGQVRLRLRLGDEVTLRVARVVNCTGPCTDVTLSGDRLTQALLRAGLARPDACRLGLDTTESGAVSQNIYALGPLTRGTFWEITAIPDIRRQCEALAQHLSQLLRSSSVGANAGDTISEWRHAGSTFSDRDRAPRAEHAA
jgi:uncharacterized NAD(P)/FAD-binding protein YdhS